MAEDKQPHRSRFHKAKDDAQFAKQATTTPQTADPAYKLAFQDNDFLLREEVLGLFVGAEALDLFQEGLEILVPAGSGERGEFVQQMDGIVREHEVATSLGDVDPSSAARRRSGGGF